MTSVTAIYICGGRLLLPISLSLRFRGQISQHSSAFSVIPLFYLVYLVYLVSFISFLRVSFASRVPRASIVPRILLVPLTSLARSLQFLLVVQRASFSEEGRGFVGVEAAFMAFVARPSVVTFRTRVWHGIRLCKPARRISAASSGQSHSFQRLFLTRLC